jgi:glycosyltransferase involved in cell wall biosynthesis
VLEVTLYIPAYNAAAFLDRVLPAVMGQTHPLAQVLVVDDGSTDDTAAVVARHAKNSRYPLRVIRHPANKGLAASRNTAIRETATDFVAALDADVLPASDWLERLAAEMTDEVSAVGGELLEHYRTSLPDRWRAVHMVQHRGPRRVWRPPFLWGCNTLFRRSVLVEAGLYPEYCRTNAEDVKLCEAIRDRHVLVYTHLAKCEHLRRDSLASLRRNFWKWYYYGCYAQPSLGGAMASNLRHARRIWGLLRRDIRDREARRGLVTLSMLPYTCAMDWTDWWRRRGETASR